MARTPELNIKPLPTRDKIGVAAVTFFLDRIHRPVAAVEFQIAQCHMSRIDQAKVLARGRAMKHGIVAGLAASMTMGCPACRDRS